ncbi:hypothetical protein TNCV_4530891 [Trichonephila clavipes]|nr:hypothetical protein TNCV_4530891 [Trichonephila clavipes]
MVLRHFRLLRSTGDHEWKVVLGCELIINHCRPSTSPGNWYHFLVRWPTGGYQSPQVSLTPSILPRMFNGNTENLPLSQDQMFFIVEKTLSTGADVPGKDFTKSHLL